LKPSRILEIFVVCPTEEGKCSQKVREKYLFAASGSRWRLRDASHLYKYSIFISRECRDKWA